MTRATSHAGLSRGMATLAATLFTLGRSYRRFDWRTGEDERTLRRFRGNTSLQIVPRQHPLDSACNPRVKRSRHPSACLQARAAICVRAQGRYDEFSDRLFDDAPVDHANLVALAVSLRLDRDRFESCLWSEGTTRELIEGIAAAIAAGVRGTPTLVINGRRHAGPLNNNDIACLTRATQQGNARAESRLMRHQTGAREMRNDQQGERRRAVREMRILLEVTNS